MLLVQLSVLIKILSVWQCMIYSITSFRIQTMQGIFETIWFGKYNEDDDNGDDFPKI